MGKDRGGTEERTRGRTRVRVRERTTKERDWGKDLG